MLDECVTKKCAHTISEFLNLSHPPIESHFLVTYMGRHGSHDCDWTLTLTPPEEWIVISSDAGRSGPRIHAKGPPLHLILPRRKITSFFLRGKTLTQVTGVERARVVITKLPTMLRMAESATPGTRHTVSRSGEGFVVREWPCRPGEIA